MAKKLKEFVNEGGGLILFAGDLVETESYNDNLRGAEFKLLPGEMIEADSFGAQSSIDEENEGSWTLGTIQSGHVLARLAESIPEEGRSSAQFSAHHESKA